MKQTILRRFGGILTAAAATAVLLTQSAMATAPLWVPQSGTGARHDSNVHFIDANTGWFTAGTKVRKTTNGGATWVEQDPVTVEGLTGIHFVDANTGWATGYYGTIRKTTNGGASWSTQAHPTGAHCWSVFALNANAAWLTGSSGMLGRTTNGGAPWTGSESNPSGNPGWGMYDVYFTDVNNGYAVAGGNWSSKTTNGGVTWTQMNTGTVAQLYKVKFVDANVGWAVGNAGTIIKTVNAGASWAAQTSGTAENLLGVSFVSASKGWVVGANGTILRTDNGGTTWTPEASGTTEYLGDVHFVDATHGWVVGNNNTVLTYNAGPVVTTVIDDKFDDGVIATNTLGTGAGFVKRGQADSTEVGGFLNNLVSSVATRVYTSNTANAFNPFASTSAELKFTYGAVNHGTGNERAWLGYRVSGAISDSFHPAQIGNPANAPKVQGLYVSVLEQNSSGYTRNGNLVAVSNTGAETALASWDWQSPATLSGVTVTLTTTATTYSVSFSGAAGAVPLNVTGALAGPLSGLGSLTTNFDVGFHSQFWSGTGSGVAIDSVLLQTGGVVAPPANTAPTDIALSSSSIAENNAANAAIGTLSATDANSGDTHTFSLVSGTGSADNGAFTITGNALTINASADFETKASYAIRIRATDSGAGSLTYEKEFTVSITDVTIPQVINFGALAGKTFGDADFNVSATGGASGQPVTFSIASGPATISGDLVSITGAGSVTVRASQAAAGDYSAASDVDQSFTVAQAAQVITFDPLSGKTFGDEPFTVFATGGASGNAVTFSASGPVSLSGNEVTITGAGSVTITASQAGNANYAAAAPVDQTFIVAKGSQTVSFTSQALAGTTDTVTLSATGGASGNAVSFSLVSGPGSLAGNVLSFTGVGPVVVRASQAGSANYEAAADVDVTINAVLNATPIAVDDAVATTTGDATVYPLANDTDGDGSPLSITGVSEPTVVIDGRALVIPAGFTGTFSYTVTDGISSDTADVVVTQRSVIGTAKRYTGLLYSSTGKIIGRATMSRTAAGLNVFNLRIGSGTGIAVFTGTSGLARTTALGPVDVTLGTDNRVTVSMAGGVNGNLRPSVQSAVLTTHNVGLASVDAAIPGAGLGRVKVTAIGLARFSLRMPDGKGFLSTAEVSDNGSINFYGRQNVTTPAGFIGGEFILANLAKTDLTGEIEWVKPAQATGLHRTGVNTVLVANGCVNTGVFGIPDGPVVVTLSGGNFPAPVVIHSTSLNAKVAAVLPTLTGWSAQTLGQTFRTTFKQPGFVRASLGTGIFFPKSQTALGFFPGTTLGGKVELRVP